MSTKTAATHFKLAYPVCITLVSLVTTAAACSSAPQPATSEGGHDAITAAAGVSAATASAETSTNSPVTKEASGDNFENAAIAASTCDGPLPVMKMLDKVSGSIVAPDWSCLNEPEPQPAAAAGAGTRTLPFSLLPFPAELVDGMSVDFFLGPSTLGPPHASRMFTGGADTVNIDVPTGQAAITVKLHGLARGDMTSIAELREYALPIKPDEPARGFTILTAQRKLIASETLGNQAVVDDDPTKAFLAAYARDCSGHDVRGAQFELFDDTGTVVQNGATTGLPHTSYMLFAIPNPECTYTSLDQAAWVMINAPVNASEAGVAKPYRLRVKGRLAETDVEPVVFGEADVEMVASAITYVHLPLQRH